jgi:flotillin
MTYDLREADNLKQTNQRKAIADMAQARKEMEVKKDVVAREQAVKEADMKQRILVATGEIQRKTQELESSMIRPAEAQKFQISKDAEARRYEIEAAATATSQELQLVGQAEARAAQVKGEAEAQAMTRKAEAWAKYSKATFLDKIIQQLPAITSARHTATSVSPLSTPSPPRRCCIA